MNSGHWTKEEDQRLSSAVRSLGQRWVQVAELVQTRNGDQCMKRWRDVINPDTNRNPWTDVEDQRLLQAVTRHGRDWTRIAAECFPSRSASSLRNREQLLKNREQRERARAEERSGPILFMNAKGDE